MLAIDGDTVYDQGERIRLVGFNTPELRSPACPREKLLAEQAKLFLEAWLSRKPILLRVGTDKYGRTLAKMIPDPGPPLIALGLAEPYDCTARCPKRRDWCN